MFYSNTKTDKSCQSRKPVAGHGDFRQSESWPLRRIDWFIMFIAAAIGAFLLFKNLDDKYLWQDEAATAVLGERMMQYGKPLAYDGRNLITMDHFAGEDIQTIDKHTGDAKSALVYYVKRGEFKADTAWIGQPWGQFLVSGISLSLLGHNTFAARAPFALAALITVVLLYWFACNVFQDRLTAVMTISLLLGNTFWVLHGRQCRYYALSGLLLLCTLIAYTSWQQKRRFGGILFILIAWIWFQVDFGAWWPVMAVLMIHALWKARLHPAKTIFAFWILMVSIIPWVWYYELFHRLKTTKISWPIKFYNNIMSINQFMIPILALAAASIFLASRYKKEHSFRIELVMIYISILIISLLWVTTVTPWYLYRYLVQLTSLAVLITAWLLVEWWKMVFRRHEKQFISAVLAIASVVIIIFCPLPSNLIPMLTGTYPLRDYQGESLIRPELSILWRELFEHQADPNRDSIELIKALAHPDDDILVNYEDIPFIFYTKNPIRGGVPCFRAEDRSSSPRYMVMRLRTPFLYWPVLIREANRYRWRRISADIPDIPYGNNPDPNFQQFRTSPKPPSLVIARCMGSKVSVYSRK